MASFCADISEYIVTDAPSESMSISPMCTEEHCKLTAIGTEEMEISENESISGSTYATEETDAFAEAPGGAIPPTVKNFLGNRQFNTTSTVMATSTIANPDLPQIFFT